MNNKIIYTPSEANEKLSRGDAILVDVRSAEEFEKEHIPGTVNIPEMFTTLSMTTPKMQPSFFPALHIVIG